MFMARLPPEHEFRRGSFPGHTQQLPSFRHFLSGVEQAKPSSVSHQEASDAPRRDLFSLREDLSHSQIKPELPPVLPPQHVEHHPNAGRMILPQATYTPIPTEQHGINRLSEPHHYPAHRKVQSSHEPLRPASAPRDSSHTKIVVRETNVEGKGICYVYDDGTVCPKAINGDVVNPKWGTTKAGKPRKRLGQACNTCREKKIRCDPQIPKCAQCQKFGRECKFETGSRGSQKGGSLSAGTSPAPLELRSDTGHDRNGSSASAETPSDQLASRENSRSSINVESLLSPSSTIASEETPPLKKRRVSISPKSDLPFTQPLRRSSTPDRLVKIDSRHAQHHQFSTNTNPLDVDKRMVFRYVHQYMDNVDSKLYHILPKQSFLQWIENGRSKSSSDLVVMYAIMAFSTTYSASGDSEREEHGRLFTSIAEDILTNHQAKCDLHCIVGQLFLSFQALSKGDIEKSKQLTTGTLRLCYDIGLHSEDGLDTLASRQMPCFDLRTETAKECMRRVFWLTYVGTCFHKYCSQGPPDREAVKFMLRLPCGDTAYDSGQIPALPVVHCNPFHPPEFSPTSRHGMIAFLVEIASVLDDIIHFQFTDTLSYKQAHDFFYQKNKARLLAWDKKMKKYLASLAQTGATTGDADASRPTSSEEHLSTESSGLHLLYHFAVLVLHRNVAWQYLSQDKLERCVKEAYNSAARTLELVHRLAEDGGATVPFGEVARTCSVASLAIFAATDVITAAGLFSDVLEHQHEGREHSFVEIVSSALTALEALSRHWRISRSQSKLVEGRLKQTLALSKTSDKNAFFFRSPLYSSFKPEHDVVYGPSRMEYFKALGLGDRVRKGKDMMEMGV